MSSFDPTESPTEYPADDPAGPATDSGQAAAGWYPVDHLSQRYWDGHEWSNHVAPLATGPAGSFLSGSMSTTDQNNYALIMHLGSLFVGFVVPLVMWLIKKDQSPFIDDHGKQLMNWHISMVIYAIVSIVLMIVLIGFLLFLVLIVVHIVFSIMGAIAANRGERYRFPLAIQFIK